MTTLKQKIWNSDQRLSLQICTIPSATVTQAFAAAGADGVIIDLEHGAIDYASAHAMIAATAGTDCAPIVRIAKCEDDHVKRVLDLGAEGICFPLIKTAREAEWAVNSLRYPPVGTRSFGPFLAQSRYQTDMLTYAKEFADRAICIILAETLEAVENIDEICAIDGIDMIIPAQFDLSTALGIPGQFDNPDFKAAIARIEAAALAANVPLGGVALAENQAMALFERGHRAVAGFDILWLRAVGAQMANWAAEPESKTK